MGTRSSLAESAGKQEHFPLRFDSSFQTTNSSEIFSRWMIFCIPLTYFSCGCIWYADILEESLLTPRIQSTHSVLQNRQSEKRNVFRAGTKHTDQLIPLSFHRLMGVIGEGHTSNEGELEIRTQETLPCKQCCKHFILQFHSLDSDWLAQIHYVRAEILFLISSMYFS